MTNPNREYDRLTRDNAVLLLIDEQVGILTGIRDMDVTELRRNVVGLAKAAKILDVPTILTATTPSLWGPVLPELIAALPNTEIIERTKLNAWDEPRVRGAVEATGRKKLIIGGIATEVCLTFAALAATAAGYNVYAAVDASGHFNRNAAVTGVLRMHQAGVIVTNSGPVVMEMLDDNADPKARDVYGALEMPHATLIGQLMSSNEKLHAPSSEKHPSQDVVA
jgi:nicotinamidase-related amidase